MAELGGRVFLEWGCFQRTHSEACRCFSGHTITVFLIPISRGFWQVAFHPELPLVQGVRMCADISAAVISRSRLQNAITAEAALAICNEANCEPAILLFCR